MEKKNFKKDQKFHSYSSCMPSEGDLFLCRDAAEYLSLRDTE